MSLDTAYSVEIQDLITALIMDTLYAEMIATNKSADKQKTVCIEERDHLKCYGHFSLRQIIVEGYEYGIYVVTDKKK